MRPVLPTVDAHGLAALRSLRGQVGTDVIVRLAEQLRDQVAESDLHDPASAVAQGAYLALANLVERINSR